MTPSAMAPGAFITIASTFEMPHVSGTAHQCVGLGVLLSVL